MAVLIEGKTDGAKGLSIGIVVSRYNHFVTKKLLETALETLEEKGIGGDDVTVVWVPGAAEIPATAKALAENKGVDAIVTLGAVIRGDTSHYDYVCAQVSEGVGRLNLESGIPIIFGVLTTENEEQAIERIDKGEEAALAALEMISVMNQIRAQQARLSRAQ